MRLHGSTAVCLFVATLLAARVVAAQSPPASRPARPLLGSTDRTTLSASLAGFAGHDRAGQESRSSSGDLHRNTDGSHSGLRVSLNYARPTRRLALSGWGSTDVRYYGRLGAVRDAVSHTSNVGLGVGAALGSRASMRVTQNLGGSSFYQFDPTSGLAIRSADDLLLPTSDYRLERGRTYRYDMTARAERRLGRRALLAFDYGYQHARFPGELVQFSGQHAGARFEHGLTRDLSFRWGYGYDQALSGNAAVSNQVHRLDIGPSYAKTLAISRRTSVSASAGAAFVTIHTRAKPESVLVLVAAASLRQRLGRTWSIGGEYRREPQMTEIYRDPTYADSAAVAVGGSATPRITVGLSGGVWRAALDPRYGATAGMTMFGSVQSQVLAARSIAVFAEYSYYAFETTTPLTAQLIATEIGRHALRTGLRWSIPLLIARR